MVQAALYAVFFVPILLIGDTIPVDIFLSTTSLTVNAGTIPELQPRNQVLAWVLLGYTVLACIGLSSRFWWRVLSPWIPSIPITVSADDWNLRYQNENMSILLTM